MNTNRFIIEEKDIALAQEICAFIQDENTRNRAVANTIASEIAYKFFDKNQFDVDSETGLHNIGSILEDIDISDIYINGNYIDIRISFEEELSIPASHVKNKLLPSAYMFIKIQTDLSDANVVGFITPDKINKDSLQDDYYYFNKNQLESFEIIKPLLIKNESLVDITDKEIFDFIDNKGNNKCIFYAKLLNSKDARIRLAKAIKAKSIFKIISVNKDMLKEFNNNENADENVNIDTDECFINNIEINNENNIDIIQNKFTTTVNHSSNKYTDDDNDELIKSLEISDELQNKDTNITKENSQIDTLFSQNDDEEQKFVTNKSSKAPILIIIIIAILAITGTVYFVKNNSTENEIDTENIPAEIDNTINSISGHTQIKEEAMPIESIEKTVQKSRMNEGNSNSIPKIEQNLNASISLDNLKINWEVPESYTSNNSAKRYLIKLGKIIQLNLKAELLLINKQPLTNKISIEIQYNKNIKKFETKQFNISSGDNYVDEIIMNTINKILNMNLNINTDSFGKLQGNPIIIINL